MFDDKAKKKIAAYLKDARTKADLSQKAVSKELGYTTAQFVSNWERGLIVPPVETLGILVRLYKISRQELVSLLKEEYGRVISAKMVGQ